MSGPVLRPLTGADASLVAALHAGSFEKPWEPADFAALLGQPGVAGWAIGTPEPAGFILVRAVADEAEILTLAVSPAQRRGGLATTLTIHALSVVTAMGAARAFLEVAADNAAALALYGNLGFKPCGHRPAYYARSDGASDAVVMMRELRDELI